MRIFREMPGEVESNDSGVVNQTTLGLSITAIFSVFVISSKTFREGQHYYIAISGPPRLFGDPKMHDLECPRMAILH